MIPWLQKIFGSCVSTIHDAFRGQPNGLFLPFVIILLLLLPVITLTLVFFTTAVDLIRGLSSFPPDYTHVPTFYVPHHRYPRWYHTLLLVTLGVIFGGIHCFGWNFSFPTYAEQKLWRVASLAVTIIPFVTLPAAFAILIMKGCSPTAIHSFVEGLFALSLISCVLAYVSARLLLLGLALALLRHLPPTAFVTIDWTKFFPHFL